MFSKGDKAKLITPVFGYKEGQICTITEATSDYVVYELDENHHGMMDIGTFSLCFEKYEEPKPKNVSNSVDSEYINCLIENSKIEVFTTHNKCTVVSCKLPNGFVITESSACVDPKNYNKELGTEICMNKIINKVWELEGYLLQQMIWECEECEKCFEECDCETCDGHDFCDSKN